MRYRECGTSGMRISEVALGCWAIGGEEVWADSDDERSRSTIRAAVEEGINFFDVAPVYGFGKAETLLGETVEELGNRSGLILATKCGLVWDDSRHIRRDLSPDSIKREIEQSLTRLRTDYIDLYQLHWPDPNVPLSKTIAALDELIQQKMIRSVGLSNFSLPATQAAHEQIGLTAYQGLYNALERNALSYHTLPLEYRTENEILPFCSTMGIGFIPYSPLLQGLLAGSIDRTTVFAKGDVRRANPKLQGTNRGRYLDALEEMSSLAAQLKRPVSQLAINWLRAHDELATVISGAQSPEQIRENCAATNWDLSDEVTARIDSIYRNAGLEELERM